MNNVGFSGARKGLTTAQLSSLRDLLTQFGPRELHHGDALGGDSQAHTLAQELGWRTVAHPAGLTSQRAFTKADEVLSVVHDPLTRNRRIVEAVSLLIACPGEPHEILRSGTYATVRYARRLGLPLYLILPDGTVQKENVE